MKKAVIYAHGGSGNHGCEALLRTTAKLLSDNGFDSLSVISRAPEEDKKYYPDFNGTITRIGEEFTGFSLSRIIAKTIKTATGSLRYYDKHEMKELFSIKNSLCLSIGGDNYCYSDYKRYMKMNAYLLENNNKTVFWGCSVSPERIKEPQVVEDLKRYSLITARESITYNAMLKVGLNNALFCPDSAFLLEATEVPLPDIFSNDVVGINVSPLIMTYEQDGGMTMKNYRRLVEHILNDTDMCVALIPHVVWDLSNDLEPLCELYEEFKSSGRVAVVDRDKRLNCKELKYIISKCRFVVTARTHASIAAYSTCVPTLVTGYSVKAKGIATDIFGSYENYVCPVQSLKDENELSNSFDFIVENEHSMKQKMNEYNNQLPKYFHEVVNCVERI